MSAAFFAASGAEDTPTIIVVGGGLAGLSASAEALRHGANVVLFDKEANIGGNSAKATSGINGAHTHHQRMFGINDSTTQFINDTLKSGRGLCNQSLVETLAENSRDAIIFLETFQLDLSLLSQCGGHSAARTHREPNTPDGKPRPVGFDIVQALKRHLEAQDSSRFRFQLRSRVHELVTSQGNVIGVRYYQAETRESMTLLGDAVILTTGGFSFDRHGFMRQFAPTLASLPTTNGPWATGDGVRLAQAIGADTRDMEQVQVHPTAFVDPGNPLAAVKFLAPEALRGSGGVLLNRQGVRFVNELATRDTVVGAMYQYAALDTPFNGHASAEAALEAAKNVHEAMPRASEALLLLDQQAVNKFGLTAFNFYHKVKGFFQSVDGASGLIQYLTILTGSPANQQLVGQTLADLTAAANGAIPDTVGRTVFASNFTDALHSPLYVARVTGAIHYTMGGLRIDSTARVMRTTQQACSSTECDDEDDVVPIAGLYAAGEVTGGVHGANRLAGNSLLECVVFGRQAAVAAVTYSRSAPSSRSSY